VETDNTYMYLSILTFLAYGAAIGLAWLLWNEYRDPNRHPGIDKPVFTQYGAPVTVVDEALT
jgi:hypothetical protein